MQTIFGFLLRLLCFIRLTALPILAKLGCSMLDHMLAIND
jgi:hypothetical protein